MAGTIDDVLYQKSRRDCLLHRLLSSGYRIVGYFTTFLPDSPSAASRIFRNGTHTPQHRQINSSSLGYDATAGSRVTFFSKFICSRVAVLHRGQTTATTVLDTPRGVTSPMSVPRTGVELAAIREPRLTSARRNNSARSSSAIPGRPSTGIRTSLLRRSVARSPTCGPIQNSNVVLLPGSVGSVCTVHSPPVSRSVNLRGP